MLFCVLNSSFEQIMLSSIPGTVEEKAAITLHIARATLTSPPAGQATLLIILLLFADSRWQASATQC
jgi:hypothetical protein